MQNPKIPEHIEQDILLRAKGHGYNFTVVALAAWSLYECYNALIMKMPFNVLPGILLMGAVAVEGFSAWLQYKKAQPAGRDWSMELLGIAAAAVLCMAIFLLLMSIF